MALKESDIADIEKCVNDSKYIFKNSNNTYSVNDEFILKPGHRALILNLPNKFKEYQDSKQTKNKRKKPTVVQKTKSDLILELRQKLECYLNKLNFAVQFDEDSVTDYFEENNSYSCRVKCPFCLKSLLCNYVSHWVVSNIEAHLKNHVKILKLNPDDAKNDDNDDPLSLGRSDLQDDLLNNYDLLEGQVPSQVQQKVELEKSPEEEDILVDDESLIGSSS